MLSGKYTMQLIGKSLKSHTNYKLSVIQRENYYGSEVRQTIDGSHDMHLRPDSNTRGPAEKIVWGWTAGS